MSAHTEDTAKILEDAFEQAFSPPPSRRQSVMPVSKGPTLEEHPSVLDSASAAAGESSSVTAESSSAAEEEAWKQEYEEQAKAWRAQSAEMRERAEKVREQWESVRAAEREEAAKRKAAGIPELEPEVIPGPPNASTSVSSSTVFVSAQEKEQVAATTGQHTVGSLDPAEAQGSVTREHHSRVESSAVSQPDTIDGSQKWEEINSPTTSSYPSMSFPEQSTPPIEHQHSHHHRSHNEPAPAPSTATLSVFDSSLSTRTRLKALASSVAINLLLPFVNGVMLGFGEIFAKNFVLGWLGWGSTAATVGISQRSRFGTRR